MALISFGNPLLAETADHALSERLDRALNAARIVWEWDLKTGQVLRSANAPDVLGLPAGPGEISWAGIHPDDATIFRRIVEGAIAGRRDYVAKVRFIRPDNGALRWVEIRGNVICESGAPVRVSGITFDVTDRDATEQALPYTEERYLAFVTASSDVVYSMSPDWTEMRFLEGKNFIADTHDSSRTWLDKYIHPEDQAHVMAVIQNAIRTKTIFQLEHRVRRVDGTLGWTFSRAIPLMDSRGNITEWFGAASDVTERKAAEEALRMSEQRFRRMVSQSVAGIAESAVDGLFLMVNDRFCEVVGYTREELLRMRRADITHPEDLPAFEKQFRRCVKNLKPFEMEKRYICKDGSIAWVHNSVAPVSGEDGHVHSIVTISVDISARTAAEHELRVRHTELESQNEELRQARQRLEASQTRYFDLYDLAPVGYLTLSEGGMIREANLTAASLLGVPRNRLPKRPLSQFIFQDDRDAYYRLIKNLSTTARPHACELRMIRDDAAPFWARLEAVASVDQDGTPGWRVLISDITGRKQAEESLCQSEENLRRLLDQVREMNVGLERRVAERTRALQEANRELEAFGCSVSHDLRAPLRTLQGFSQALLEDYLAELPPKARRYLERIGVAAARMDELIQDLLAYSRLARAELRLEPLDLSGVVSEACQQLQAAIDETRVTMEVGPLPVVCGHRGTLVQIFANLFSNSLKFVSPGERPSIRVSAEPRGSAVRVWVADNGIGIEPEHRERIFEVFQRLHGLETHPGTGIGLAIVRRGAERLGGAAGVESEPGCGSRFWVDLKPAEDN